ncbi:S41 family peptidase [Aureibaculum sp. 2210JD6-5]|uniref:S41 family peptidase n=1 Tax=Aureibaculum sp. 2210JD6-5 TaxID=3103957 RepID=UPI002AAD756E|nr:S41 family peptidase [Aureibaculum sp. 2210JD6-5]MDY7396194.1 S41 family peptidase [Aureibaculum sp. 2210JD6-5]
MKRVKQLGITAVLIIVLTISVGYKSDFFEVAKQIEIYTTLFKELNMYYIDETNPAELTETAIDNMLKELDPYTRFYDEQGVEKARINAASDNGGIGASTKIIDEKLFIAEPYEGAVADKAGLKAGDEILKINELALKNVPAIDAMSMLNGNPDSEVTLQLKRQDKTFSTTITREANEFDPVPYYTMLDDKVGYISFIKFNTKASSNVKAAFEDLKMQGMTKLVLDIRGNLGGLLNEAVEITNFFVPKNEVVVTTKAKVKKWSDTYKTKREPIDLEIPIVVLIDRYSASASEIVAGSLQDLDRAVIIGERSFGKGLVQRYRKLTYGTQLKLTISKYYTPSGRCIQELDYAHKDKNGEVTKFSDVKRNAFKTQNGRTVYDGGGIEPDIKLTKTDRTNATDALLESDAIFMFATDFANQHKTIESTEKFTLSDDDYQNFITFLTENKDVFKTETDNQMEDVLRTANKEGYSESINQEYQSLISKINSEKIKELSENKSEIKDALTNEIVRRYYYKKGEYIHKATHDKAIIEALQILKDESKYQNILK